MSCPGSGPDVLRPLRVPDVRGKPLLNPRPPNVPLFRALWSLLDGIWGSLKGSWGVLDDAGIQHYEMEVSSDLGALQIPQIDSNTGTWLLHDSPSQRPWSVEFMNMRGTKKNLVSSIELPVGPRGYLKSL